MIDPVLIAPVAVVVAGALGVAFLAGMWHERRRSFVRGLGYPRGSVEADRLGAEVAPPVPVMAGPPSDPAGAARWARERIEEFPAGPGVHVVQTPDVGPDFDPPSAVLRPVGFGTVAAGRPRTRVVLGRGDDGSLRYS